MIDDLKKLGLSRNEAAVYLALLRIGATAAGELIKRTKLHRNIVYDNLDRLIEKGLVSFVTVRNVKRFEAAPSGELKDFIERQKQEVLEKEKAVQSLLPQIEGIRKSAEGKQEATVFRGRRGLKNVLEGMARAKGEILVFGTGWGMRETMGSYYDQWHLKLCENKVRGRILLPQDRKGLYKRPFRARYLSERSVIPTTIAVYEENVLNVVWGEEPVAVLIQSRKAAESHRRYFEMLWKGART